MPAPENEHETKVSDEPDGVTIRHVANLTKRYKGRDQAQKKSPNKYSERDWSPIMYSSKEMPRRYK